MECLRRFDKKNSSTSTKMTNINLSKEIKKEIKKVPKNAGKNFKNFE